MRTRNPNLPEIPAILRYRAENFPDEWKTVAGPDGLELHGPSGCVRVFRGENAEVLARRRAWELHDGEAVTEALPW